MEEFDTGNLDDMKSKGFHVVDYTKSEDGDRWLPLTTKAKEIIRRVDCKVLDALEDRKDTKSDQKIVSFPKKKKAENLEISTFPAL